jgi:hypothetical protein
MTEQLYPQYLVLETALEEIVAGQETDGTIGTVKCAYCGIHTPAKFRNKLSHKNDCPALIAAKALSKVKNVVDIVTQED